MKENTVILEEGISNGVYISNYTTVIGDVLSEPVYHHKTHDEDIYQFYVSIPRLNSEVKDVLPIEVSERAIDLSLIKEGKVVGIEGQFRSFNKLNKETGKINLILSIFVRDLIVFGEDENYDYTNYIRLIGHICKKPVYRNTPSGREISDIILAVNRVYGRSDYIPCISWGRNARYASNLEVGTKVLIEGRVQSRKYVKKVNNELETHIVYEVSSSKISVINPEDSEVEE